jgi:drug/metabolite transporter (DMT)-like permease
VLPFVLYTKGLSQLETSRAAIIATLEPVVATIIGIFLFKESISIIKIIGIALVIVAIAILREKNEKDLDEIESA